MRFAAESNLYLLLLVPLLGALAAVSLWRKRATARRFADAELLRRLVPGHSPARDILSAILVLSALVLLVIALARPQFGTRVRIAKKRGIDVVVALDLSRSMLARDVSTGSAGSRLKRAKLEVAGLIDRLQGDRIGLVGFAGTAFVQCPLTSDYAAAKLFLRAMEVGTIPVGGTSLAEAMGAAADVFEGARGGTRSRVLVLISDGEDLYGEWEKQLERLKDLGVVVHTVGVGTRIGELIPLPEGGYLRHEDKVVMSRLDEGTLRHIAEETGGIYVHSASGDLGFDAIYDRLAQMKKSEFEARLESVYEERFQLFVLFAMILLLAAWCMPRGSAARGEAGR